MEEELVPMPIPALVAVLLHHEKAKGSPLTKEEVEQIRDKAVCMMVPVSKVKAMADARGYEDINPELAWEHWQAVRGQLGQSS